MNASLPGHHLILINGPPRAGKSLASRMLVDMAQEEIRIFYLSEQLKRATHCAYGMFDVPFDFFEDCKDKESECFFRMTPRQAYIAHSETYMKKLHGKDVFIKMFVKLLLLCPPYISVVADVGFQAEVDYIRTTWQLGKIFLLRMHRARTSFVGDSRSFVQGGPGIVEIDIHNDTIEHLADELKAVLRSMTGLARSVADLAENLPA